MSYASYHPGKTEASVMTLSSSLGIPSDPLGSHLWIVAGVAPGSIHRLAELMSTDIGLICRLAGISRHTVARKLRIGALLSTSQGARVYCVVQALEAVLSLHRNNTARALSWLHRPAWGLGGKRPAEVLSTALGAQAVIVLVGRIQHGVCT
ncbi:antitoxin Xre/MbcA/ParS toxin-binding domain-containing protein [Aeromonas veronii]